MTPTPVDTSAARRPHRPGRRTIVLAVAGVLALAVHLGPIGLALANSGWTRGAADVVLAIVAGKVLLIVAGRFVFRRGKAARRTAHTPRSPDAPIS
jgi:hypothetical protein